MCDGCLCGGCDSCTLWVKAATAAPAAIEWRNGWVDGWMGLVLVLNGGYKWDEIRDISSCVNVISYYWLLASTILFLGWDDWISDVAMIGGSDGWWIRWLCLWLLWLLWCVLRLLLLLLWFLFFVFVIFDIDAQMDMDFWIFVWFLFLFVLLSPSPFFVLQCAPIFGSSSNQVYYLWYTTCEYCLRHTHESNTLRGWWEIMINLFFFFVCFYWKYKIN